MTVCPSCGTENPDGARFCNACATPLEPERAGRKERKFATALFADLVGSTTLAEREDPEVVQSIVAGRGSQFDPDVVDAFLRVREEWRRIAIEFADEHDEAPAPDGPDGPRLDAV